MHTQEIIIRKQHLKTHKIICNAHTSVHRSLYVAPIFPAFISIANASKKMLNDLVNNLSI